MDLDNFEQALFAQAEQQGFSEMELYYEPSMICSTTWKALPMI